MSTYTLSHLADSTLLRQLATLVARDRATTAELLAHIAEVDARKLYLPAAYPSMYAYCVGELHLSEEAAFKRIHAARAARRFPGLFDAVAQGRLHLSAAVLLAPHLRPENVDELLAAATHMSKSEIERLLAERFPKPDVLGWVQEISPPAAALPTATPGPEPVVEPLSPGMVAAQHAPGRTGKALPLVPEGAGVAPQHAPGRVEEPVALPVPTQPASRHVVDRSRVTPLAPQRFAVQFTLSQRAHDKLRYAQALMGHQVPSGDLAALFERALDALIPQLERTKFAATGRPRSGGRRSRAGSLHIPAHVKRTVWERDQGRCTFVSETGRRCPACTRLEFDHVEAVARGGEASVAGIRLRCRAHNQYEAERTFGAEFMRRKRHAAAEARAAVKAQGAARVQVEAAVRAAVVGRADE